MMSVQPRTVVWIVRLLALAPFGWLALLYLFVLRARLQLGFWPLPSRPDPKSLGLELHHALVWLGALLFPFPVLLALGFALHGHRVHHRPFPWRLIGVAAVGAAAVLTIAHFDPGLFIAWFVD